MSLDTGLGYTKRSLALFSLEYFVMRESIKSRSNRVSPVYCTVCNNKDEQSLGLKFRY